MNIRDKDELVCVQTWILVNGIGVQKDEWITKAQQASLAEELESEERLVYKNSITLQNLLASVGVEHEDRVILVVMTLIAVLVSKRRRLVLHVLPLSRT